MNGLNDVGNGRCPDFSATTHRRIILRPDFFALTTGRAFLNVDIFFFDGGLFLEVERCLRISLLLSFSHFLKHDTGCHNGFVVAGWLVIARVGRRRGHFFGLYHAESIWETALAIFVLHGLPDRGQVKVKV